jgi:hypothetical protein
VKGFPKLTELDLSGCQRISDQSVLQLANSCCDMEVLSLKLCLKLTDRSLSVVLNNLGKLRSLNLKRCGRMTNEAFANFSCKDLLQLNVNYCTSITPNALLKVISVAPLLANISFHYVSMLSDEDLTNLGKFIERYFSISSYSCASSANYDYQMLKRKEIEHV